MWCFLFLVLFLFVNVLVDWLQEVLFFNGCDFFGWMFFFEEMGFNVDGKVWILDFVLIKLGGVIEINLWMYGVLMIMCDYLNYWLCVEFCWVLFVFRDDSGIFLCICLLFVWDVEYGELVWFYMLQIQFGNIGDLWVMGYSESKLKIDFVCSYKLFGLFELGLGGYIC